MSGTITEFRITELVKGSESYADFDLNCNIISFVDICGSGSYFDETNGICSGKIALNSKHVTLAAAPATILLTVSLVLLLMSLILRATVCNVETSKSTVARNAMTGIIKTEMDVTHSVN